MSCSTCCTTFWYHESHYVAFGDFLVSVLCVPNFVFWISYCFCLDGISVWSWCEMFRDFLDCGSLAGLLGSDSMPTGNRRLCFASLWHWNETVSKDCYNAKLEGYAYKEILLQLEKYFVLELQSCAPATDWFFKVKLISIWCNQVEYGHWAVRSLYMPRNHLVWLVHQIATTECLIMFSAGISLMHVSHRAD